MNRKGILYGVGTGPGDPELLTLKAVRVIREADVIAVPNEEPENCIPYKTVAAVYPELASKEILAVPFLMKPDQAARQAVRKQNAEKIAAVLDQGRNVAFLTIGDPSIYTTYSYVFALLEPMGYECRMISGVPSFCGASARMNVTLCSDQERLEIVPGGTRSPELHVPEQPDRVHQNGRTTAGIRDAVPADSEDSAASDGIEDQAFPLPAGSPGCGTGITRIYMKYESRFPDLIATLRSRGESPMVIENCFLENERVFKDTGSLPPDIGYFNIVISHSEDTDL